MIGYRSGPFTALAFLLTPCVASPAYADTLVLEPSQPWHVDYHADSCRMSRTFGEGGNQLIAMFDQFAPSTVLDVSLAGKQLGVHDGMTRRVAFGFGPLTQMPEAQDVLTGFMGKDKLPILFIGPRDLRNDTAKATNDITPDDEAGITEIRAMTDTRTLVLRIAGLQGAMTAMRTCTTDLLRQWGLDADQQAQLSQPATPKGNPGVWLTSADYPLEALQNRASAIIHFRVMIDTTGMPSECHIQQATQSPELIARTCNLLMQRARFTPAIGADGKPVPSFYVSCVRWVISPGRTPRTGR